MRTVTATVIPGKSALQPSLATASFYDAYSAPLSDGALSPTEIFLRASRATPGRVGALMSISNRIVRQLGLKDVGSMDGKTRKGGTAARHRRLPPGCTGLGSEALRQKLAQLRGVDRGARAQLAWSDLCGARWSYPSARCQGHDAADGDVNACAIECRYRG